jgi:hypothetical protein
LLRRKTCAAGAVFFLSALAVFFCLVMFLFLCKFYAKFFAARQILGVYPEKKAKAEKENKSWERK